MKRFGVWFVAATVAGALSATPSLAADDSMVDINFLVSSVYTYSFDNPADDSITGRVIDYKDKEFNLNAASLFMSRMRDDEDFGFGLGIDLGDTAEVGSVWPSDAENSDSFEVREAFLTYNLPFMDATVKAGKFPTLLGYEVLKTQDSFNHNISHAMLFGFAVPFTNTGVMLSAPLGDMAGIDLAVVNGWDNVKDNNNSPSIMGGFGLTPSDMFSTYVAAIYGGESDPIANGVKAPGAAGAGEKRFAVTANATMTLSEQFSVVVDSVYGSEGGIAPAAGGDGVRNGKWYGLGTYLLFDASDCLSFALRSEVFDDEGARGSFGDVASERVTVWEVTPTVALKLGDHVTLRAEYRHDEASQPVYAVADGNAQDSWDTVAAELILGF